MLLNKPQINNQLEIAHTDGTAMPPTELRLLRNVEGLGHNLHLFVFPSTVWWPVSGNGVRNQEWLCWRGPAAIYWTAQKLVVALTWHTELRKARLYLPSRGGVTRSSQLLLSSKGNHCFKTCKSLERTKLWPWDLMDPETKNDCAGEDQEQFAGLDCLTTSFPPNSVAPCNWVLFEKLADSCNSQRSPTYV
jgi:hypothetical protein